MSPVSDATVTPDAPPHEPHQPHQPRLFPSLAEFATQVGQETGVSDWLLIEQSRIQQFAQATGDLQWIHLDAERAAAGPFGSTIAHGFLTLSLIPVLAASAYTIGDVRMGVNYGLNKVRFTSPVPVNSRVRARMTLLSVDAIEGGCQVVSRVDIEREGTAKPVCIAESVARLYV